MNSCELFVIFSQVFSKRINVSLQRNFKSIINMKKVIYFLLIGGAIIYSHRSKAEPYYLSRTGIYVGQGNHNGSKAPARPLCIDITANVITVPEQLVGYTLTLSNGEDCYTYIISDPTLYIPQGISGEYELTITNGNVCYQGEVEI